MGESGRMDKQKVADSQAKTTQGKFIRKLSLHLQHYKTNLLNMQTQIFKNQQHIRQKEN